MVESRCQFEYTVKWLKLKGIEGEAGGIENVGVMIHPTTTDTCLPHGNTFLTPLYLLYSFPREHSRILLISDSYLPWFHHL